jgi:hypothetical protein
MELIWLDQDALNLAFNPACVYFLPVKFCIVPTQFRTQKHRAYALHYASVRKTNTSWFWPKVVHSYLNARNKWKKSHSHDLHQSIT